MVAGITTRGVPRLDGRKKERKEERKNKTKERKKNEEEASPLPNSSIKYLVTASMADIAFFSKVTQFYLFSDFLFFYWFD